MYGFWTREHSDAYFGPEQVSVAEYFTFTGVSEEGKSITAKLLGFRILDNVQLSLYAAITTTETPASEEGEALEASREGNLENFIQAGGNATLTAEVPLVAYMPKRSKEAQLQDVLSLSFVPALNLEVAPLGSATENGVRVGQAGLRFFGQKAALDSGDIAVFGDVWLGGLWGTADFFGAIGQPGRKSALYGKATLGLALLKKVRLNLTKVVLGPEQMRSPWIVSLAVSP
ncbi:hypothetical protein [Myxococcus sp. CA040A]|uniref:hypothetical protein n=1 Tax=Myxococcus sp. CA040A TaxID=2741738 RepID=UPI00157A8106|nr:hypothetical protein [Myxococcus sp. CA040A]NTX04624.1 hypothetical protein [Myxococcus sp. CA040A]